MGYNQEKIEVVLSTSNHNDERDERDEKLAEELRAEIERLLQQPKYEPLRAILI